MITWHPQHPVLRSAGSVWTRMLPPHGTARRGAARRDALLATHSPSVQPLPSFIYAQGSFLLGTPSHPLFLLS